MALVADAFVNCLVEKLITLAEGEMSTLLGVEEEVKKLQMTLERHKVLLQYAEQQRHAGAHITTLLKELKDVMYDADQIIDTCTMEGGKLLGVERPSPRLMGSYIKTISSCFRCFKYRHEIGAEIKKLHDRINDIAKDNQIMATIPKSYGSQSSGQGSRERAGETSHLQDVTRIVGSQIKEAATKLIDCIFHSDGREKCRLFAITGMGGIGKTTLACKVFNDEIITSNFHAPNDNAMSSSYFLSRRIWLHVSKDYSVTELLKEMVRNFGGGSDEGLRSRAELDAKLVSLLPESLFLVLDDVWNEKVWNEILRETLSNIRQNIIVLVTTRDDKVAKSLRANYIHHVERMDNDSCWELLCREVFMDTDENEIRSLKEVGYQIVNKCDGLPLAVKAIAGVLKPRDKNITEWDKVARSAIWSMDKMDDEVPRAMYLSYEDLLPGQKQCFMYCSFLSQKGPLYMRDVVSYLVDEGLVPTNNGQQSMEEVAEDWYMELIWRNLFQLDPTIADGSVVCTMHDLLKSFGQSLMEGEATCIRDQSQIVRRNPLMQLRRLLMMSNTETLKLPYCVTKPERLRAFFLWEGSQIKSIEEGLIGKLCNLRILMLSDTNIEELPRSIDNLFPLRHLDLDRTHIKEIPDSIGDLSNLQTLRAGGCQFLHQLPKTVTRLLKLRFLDLRNTPFNHLPQGIGKLQDLHTLRGLTVGHDPECISKKGEQCCDLDEIQHLRNLKALGLYKLHRSNIGGKVGSALADKSFLRRLELSAAAATSLSQEQIESTKVIYDGLTLPRNLRILVFDNYPCLEFPKWLMPPPSSSSLDDSFPNLTILHLINAASCKELPPQLSWLPQLMHLRVSSIDAITTIGPQFFSCRSGAVAAFPKLEVLEFTQMPNWEEWSSSSVDGREAVDKASSSGSIMVTKQLLPCLSKLVLVDCPMLKALPRCLSLATNLQKIGISGASGLRKIDDLPLRENMLLAKCGGLKELCNLPSLRSLDIVDCPALETVRNLPALEYLSAIVRQQLPRWLPELALQPGLKKLDIYCPRKLFIESTEDDPKWHFMHQIGKDVTVGVRVLDESS